MTKKFDSPSKSDDVLKSDKNNNDLACCRLNTAADIVSENATREAAHIAWIDAASRGLETLERDHGVHPGASGRTEGPDRQPIPFPRRTGPLPDRR